MTKEAVTVVTETGFIWSTRQNSEISSDWVEPAEVWYQQELRPSVSAQVHKTNTPPLKTPAHPRARTLPTTVEVVGLKP